MAAASRKHDVTIWDVKNKKLVALLRGNDEGCKTLDWSSDGRYVASTSQTAARIWDLQDPVSTNEISTSVANQWTELFWNAEHRVNSQ